MIGLGALMIAIVWPILGAIFAAIYLALFRKINPNLPFWLQTKAVQLEWKDLRLPAALAVISIMVGLFIIT